MAPTTPSRTFSPGGGAVDDARAENRRKAAEIVFSLVCDLIAHDAPESDGVDAELRSLAEEFRRRGRLPDPIRRDVPKRVLSTRVDKRPAGTIKPPWED